jgi:hypothetical protein
MLCPSVSFPRLEKFEPVATALRMDTALPTHKESIIEALAERLPCCRSDTDEPRCRKSVRVNEPAPRHKLAKLSPLPNRVDPRIDKPDPIQNRSKMLRLAPVFTSIEAEI